MLNLIKELWCPKNDNKLEKKKMIEKVNQFYHHAVSYLRVFCPIYFESF